MSIDYALANREGRQLRSALTRAVNSGDPEKVEMACRKAVSRWEAWGAWPDDWSRWQRALDDRLPWPGDGLRLEDFT